MPNIKTVNSIATADAFDELERTGQFIHRAAPALRSPAGQKG